jgi:hypothetical protein
MRNLRFSVLSLALAPILLGGSQGAGAQVGDISGTLILEQRLDQMDNEDNGLINGSAQMQPAAEETSASTAKQSPTTGVQGPAGNGSKQRLVSRSETAKKAIGRWLDLQNATLNLRYRYADNSAGVITTNQLQHKETLRFRLKFDKPGRYALNFGLFTGVRFTSGWDNTGWGINKAQRNLAFKALYLAAQPIAGVEAQAGGLYIVKGESTEFTTYDEDGYIMGERVSIRRPKQLFFDEISVTNAYFVGGTGPANIPVSKRFPHIGEPNYQHYLLDKKFGKRAGVSADYTVESGRRTWRQAVNVKLRELRVVDSILFENYERENRNRAYGFAITAEKALNKHLSLLAGYARIDPQYGPLNADGFNIGNRAFVMATYVFSPEFTASAFVTTAAGRNGALPQRTLSNTVFTYNALPALKRTGLF